MRGTGPRARAAASITLGVAAILAMTPASPSHADGAFRWATAGNYGNGYLFLEVLSSSTADTASVIAYPSNSGSANKWWSDYQLSNGYFALLNHNSGKALDRWDYGTGPGTDGGCGRPMQYSWVDQSQQHWAYRLEWSNNYSRYFTKWVNRYGCSGDPYQDSLAVNYSTAAGNGRYTSLLHANRCVDGDNYGIYTRCYWRRNGE
jgi:hypothetical protein